MGRTPRQLIAVAIISGTLGLIAVSTQRPAHAQSAAVTIQNFAFMPATLTVPVGTTVTWTNNDTAPHTSTSDPGDAVAWSSPTLSQGQSFSFTFTAAGTFPYHCAVHPHMKAMIVVQQEQAASPTTAQTTATSPVPTSAPTATGIPLSAVPIPAMSGMGAPSMLSQPTWQGYYDGHKDTYLSTDVSNKTLAAAMHIRYAPALRHAARSSVNPIYLVPGRSAANQLAVFGSEPGDSNYSPLWREMMVTWRAGARPVLLTSDNQILALQKKGKLSLHKSSTILNCPIITSPGGQ